jgi:hypothetical protein
MTQTEDRRARQWARTVAGAIGLAVVGTGVVVAQPASALEGDYGTATTVQIAGDLRLDGIRYDFTADEESVSPGPYAEVGPESTSSSATWSMGAHESTTARTQMIGRIVDFGKQTDYWIRAATEVRAGVEIYWSWCEVYLGDPAAGGIKLDQDTASPYRCFSSDRQTVTGGHPLSMHLETFTLSSLNWATARGAISPQGSIMLGDGHLESPSTRFIVDGRWFPSDPAEQAPFNTIEPGATLDWAAFRRNGESDANASGYFSYRIYDGGVPTRFWVSGMASNWRGVEFNWDYTCQIFDGDPLEGASAVDQSPYLCEMATTTVNGNGDYRVDFTIRTAPIQTLGPLQARDLMSEGCGDAGDVCYFVPATNDAYVPPGQPLGPPYANAGDEEAEYEFYYATGRSTTNSVDVSLSAQANVLDIFKATIKIAYGWEETDEVDKKWIATMKVPAHEEGWFEFAPAYRRISGDFLFEVNGTWYRVANGTFTVPDSTVPGTLTSHTRPIVGSPGGGTGSEPPATPTPVDPAPAGQKSGTTRGAASGNLAATGGATDPSASGLIAGALLLAGTAALSAAHLSRRRVRKATR